MLEIADEDAKTVIIKTVFHMFISLRRETWKIKKKPKSIYTIENYSVWNERYTEWEISIRV